MTTWWSDLKKILQWGLYALGMILAIFIINQFILLYQLLHNIHPYLAIGIVTVLIVALIVMIFKIYQQFNSAPTVLTLDADASEEEIVIYQKQVYAQLKKNPYLQDLNWDDDGDISDQVAEGLQHLQTLTNPLIQENANAIFLTTAVSQNGSLDSLVVLYTLLRMVWQIAKIYGTRPSLHSLFKLYLQVASVILMARAIEDIDLIEYQIEPIITSVLGESVVSAVPGMVPIANLVVSSILEGAVNSFLTLRVGIITQDCLTSQTPINKKDIRHDATVRALPKLKLVVKDNAGHIVKTIGRAAKNVGKSTAKKWFNLV
ncbi:DUF697 domain-containing protein [Aerococcaceae bacterium DSM 111020]|nr:DUF697 domain-containing protein [Aerococcaceae bacterium DSM 111020]